MKLYKVKYKTWDMFFSHLYDHEMLSVGKNEEDAINRVKTVVEKDARDFEAIKIKSVFGHNIVVENK